MYRPYTRPANTPSNNARPTSRTGRSNPDSPARAVTAEASTLAANSRRRPSSAATSSRTAPADAPAGESTATA